MSELGTNVQTESLQHMLDCKNGKHELGAAQNAFTYKDKHYVYGQCMHCYKSFYTREGKVISMDEFFKAHDALMKEIW